MHSHQPHYSITIADDTQAASRAPRARVEPLAPALSNDVRVNAAVGLRLMSAALEAQRARYGLPR